jgi:hypothetical protein
MGSAGCGSGMASGATTGGGVGGAGGGVAAEEGTIAGGGAGAGGAVVGALGGGVAATGGTAATGGAAATAGAASGGGATAGGAASSGGADAGGVAVGAGAVAAPGIPERMANSSGESGLNSTISRPRARRKAPSGSRLTTRSVRFHRPSSVPPAVRITVCGSSVIVEGNPFSIDPGILTSPVNVVVIPSPIVGQRPHRQAEAST